MTLTPSLQSVEAAYQQASPWSDVPLFDISDSVSAGQESKKESSARGNGRKLFAARGSSDAVLGGLWSEPGVVAGQAKLAAARLEVQGVPALVEALSDVELGAQRKLAEWKREKRLEAEREAFLRQLEQDKKKARQAAELDAVAAKDRLDYQKAVAARRRVTSLDGRVAITFRRARASSWALMAVMAVGMAWGAVNIQSNFATSTSDPLYWLSYGIEALLSVPLIVIMMQTATAMLWGRTINRRKVLGKELVFVLVNLGLNTGPYLAGWHLTDAAYHGAAPALVAAAVWLHSATSQHYADLIKHAHIPDDNPADAGRLGVDQAKLLDAIAKVQAGMAQGLLAPSGGAAAPSASKIADVYGMSKPDAIIVRDAMNRLARQAA